MVELKQDQASVYVTELEIGIEGRDSTSVVTVQVDEASETFRIPADAEPRGVTLDPNVWLLMESTDFVKR